MLTAAGAALSLALLIPTIAWSAQPAPQRCAVVDESGRCLVEAVDPGRPGGPLGPPSDTRSSPASSSSNSGEPTEPPPWRPRIVGAPGEGPGIGVVNQAYLEMLAAAEAAAAEQAAGAAPAVPVAVLAQRAINELELAPPQPHLSVESTGHVGVPLWLWIDDGPGATGPVSATATAGAAEVTATATVSRVVWEMGPPGETVTCAGPGTPWAGQDGPSPTCGYTYTERSLPERTGGTGSWTVTATAVWTVVWTGISGGVPVAGEDVVEVATVQELPVGEVQVLATRGGS